MPQVGQRLETSCVTEAEGVEKNVTQEGEQIFALKKSNSASKEQVLETTETKLSRRAPLGTENMMPNLETQDEEEEGVGDARWPPAEELVAVDASPGATARPVCFDLEATGLEPGSRMLQLAAFHPRAPADCFSRYVLPPPGAAMEPGAVRATGLDLRGDAHGHRQLHDVRTGEGLPTVSEKDALLAFVEWLHALAPAGDGRSAGGDRAGAGVVLVSHGAIFLDVPILVAAVRDCGLEEPFYKVVRGFCDSQAVFQAAAAEAAPGAYASLGLDALYQQVVGTPLGDTHRADVDARHLHELLCTHLQAEELTLELEPLARFSYTARCMRHLAHWKAEWCDAHWDELWATVASTLCRTRLGRTPGLKARRVLVRNLLAAGYDLSSLHTDWCHGGRDMVLDRITRMKTERESYLTDSRCLTAEEVADRVADYFVSVAARGYDVRVPLRITASPTQPATTPPTQTPTPKTAPSRRRGPWRTVEQ